MKNLSGLRALLVAALLLPGAVSEARAQAAGDGVVVHFKDGSHISGVLVESTKKHVTVQVGGAQASWPVDQIQSVEKKKSALLRLRQLVKAAGADPVKIKAAAQFAQRHRLYTDYGKLAAAHPDLFPQDDAAAPPPVPSAPRAGGACLALDPQTAIPTSDLPDAGPGYARSFMAGVADLETLRQNCTPLLYQQLLDDYVKAGNKNAAYWEVVLYNADGTVSQSRRQEAGREERRRPDPR